MPTVNYPFDTTGIAATNLVTGELDTVTEVNAAPYRILIPSFAPFYLHNLLIEHINELGVAQPLIEGVDFYATLPYMAATRSTGKPVYGGLSILSELPQGTIRLQYQTVGGTWCADRDYVYNQLLTDLYNPRTAWWDQLTNVQDLFPPTVHEQPIGDVMGHEAILAVLGQIREAIITNPNTVPAFFFEHVLNLGNPHQLSKLDIGLEKVANYELATDEEVIGRVVTDKYVTLRQVLMLLNP